eukprot:CAMPEP_0197266274 /NCGR_PEP_ID=MMETSP1432-20130617/2904_1 /TAXON_ID=44447 /ORGANISM="Pseudo-nitzschia delicatissima, Strain UNC1205" /LENGTH=475 /DNA_ID=CAMNT_0042731123 /DNA_START=202 /DNA_END=1629 /DNA_ORIENTATION=-
MNTCVDAFQTMSPKSFSVGTSRGSRCHLEAVPLHELPLQADQLDPQELSVHVHALHGFLQHHTSMLLSDASVATADMDPMEALEKFEAAEAAVVADEGWWKAYLNVFKATLDLIHSKVDGPIHKLGWEGGTWGFSIAIFTAGVRSLLIPLSFQQTKATEMQKALKPYMDEINAKFKDNENRKNQLVGKLYEDADQNPLSGCFLSLLQLPLILGLYRGVRLLALDGKLDESFLWIPSLQGPVTAETDYRGMDWLMQGWEQIDGTWTPQLGWETTLAFCVMPVLLVLGQKLTMEALQPPEADESSMDEEAKKSMETTKTVLKFLPLLIGFFSLQVPAALTIYWFTSNFFTLSQALIVRKYYEQNPPEINLPEYWDALGEDENEMTPEERRAAAKAGIAKGPTIEDWIANAKFHTLVERESLNFRQSFEAWKEANADSKLVVPAEFQAWVDMPVELPNGATNGVEAKKEQEPIPQAAA